MPKKYLREPKYFMKNSELSESIRVLRSCSEELEDNITYTVDE